VDHAVVHEYDTADRDLERLGLTIARLPSEAGVMWRLELPRGERVEAWEPGTSGLAPPAEVMRYVDAVAAGKPLVPSPPLGSDPGTRRLHDLLNAQRRSLLAHDPDTRLGEDPENLHQHRVAARRARAFVRATRGHVDPEWRRSLVEPLRRLGRATGPVRDLDVFLEHLKPQLAGLDAGEEQGAATLAWLVVQQRDAARRRLLETLDEEGYRGLLGRLQLPPRLRPGREEVPLDELARDEFRRLARAVTRLGRRPGDVTVHDLRIVLKNARYAAELAAPRGTAGLRFLEAAKTLQELLGEHQDAVAAEALLRTTTMVDAKTGAAFVAGRLAERQVARRQRVLERLPSAWRRLRKRSAAL
jgi:CHAD domain-containing protein